MKKTRIDWWKIVVRTTLIICAMLFLSMLTSKAEAYDVINDTKFKQSLPSFKDAIVNDWPTMNPKSHYFAGQAEQESCASRTKCWNPTTELKTSREYGFGIPQITITSKFNNFTGLKQQNAKLKNWQWEQRYDPYYQFIAMFTLNRTCYNQVKWAGKEEDRMAMMFSCYNGGYGGILKDRAICSNTKGCNPNLWFNNIEKYSTKSKVAVKGYGKSFFEINREYPKNIMYVRSPKYKPYLKDVANGTYKPTRTK